MIGLMEMGIVTLSDGDSDGGVDKLEILSDGDSDGGVDKLEILGDGDIDGNWDGEFDDGNWVDGNGEGASEGTWEGACDGNGEGVCEGEGEGKSVGGEDCCCNITSALSHFNKVSANILATIIEPSCKNCKWNETR